MKALDWAETQLGNCPSTSLASEILKSLIMSARSHTRDFQSCIQSYISTYVCHIVSGVFTCCVRRNASLWTPLDHAADKGYADIIALLLEADAPLEAKDKSSVSAAMGSGNNA